MAGAHQVGVGPGEHPGLVGVGHGGRMPASASECGDEWTPSRRVPSGSVEPLFDSRSASQGSQPVAARAPWVQANEASTSTSTGRQGRVAADVVGVESRPLAR